MLPDPTDFGVADLIATISELALQIRRAREELAANLRSAYTAGASLRSLADAALLSHEHVRRLVYRADCGVGERIDRSAEGRNAGGGGPQIADGRREHAEDPQTGRE
jgi:hypothetical protein